MFWSEYTGSIRKSAHTPTKIFGHYSCSSRIKTAMVLDEMRKTWVFYSALSFYTNFSTAVRKENNEFCVSKVSQILAPSV